MENMFGNNYNLATRYELLNSIILTWNNIFYIRLYAICSTEIYKHINCWKLWHKQKLNVFMCRKVDLTWWNMSIDFQFHGWLISHVPPWIDSTPTKLNMIILTIFLFVIEPYGIPLDFTTIKNYQHHLILFCLKFWLLENSHLKI